MPVLRAPIHAPCRHARPGRSILPASQADAPVRFAPCNRPFGGLHGRRGVLHDAGVPVSRGGNLPRSVPFEKARGTAPSAAALALALILALVAALVAVAEPAGGGLVAIPPLQGTVVDAAGVLSADEIAQVDARLRQLRQESGAQVVALVVDHTTPETLEDFAQRAFTAWKPGRKGIDDGLLFLLAVNNPPPGTRIHTGYGLEGSLPDATAKRILAEHVRPALQARGPGAAVKVAVDELYNVLATQPAAAPHASAATPVDAPYGIRTYHASEPEKRMLLGALALIGGMVLVALLLAMLPWRPVRRVISVAACLAIAGLVLWVAQASWTAALAVMWLIAAAWASLAEPVSAGAAVAPSPKSRRAKHGGATKPQRAGPARRSARRSGGGMRGWIVPLASLAGIAIVANYATGMLGYALGATGWFMGSLVITTSIRSRLSPAPQRARRRGDSSDSSGDTWSGSSDGWSSDSSDSGSSDSGGGCDSGGGGSSD